MVCGRYYINTRCLGGILHMPYLLSFDEQSYLHREKDMRSSPHVLLSDRSELTIIGINSVMQD